MYYQNSLSSICIESMLQSFVQKRHECFLLTTSEKGLLHHKVDKFGVKTFSSFKEGKSSYMSDLAFLINFSKKNKIDVIYSHLQRPNLIALLSKYFIKAKVFPCRHHMDDVSLSNNRNSILIDKLINALSIKIVVVSNNVKQYMVSVEKVKQNKIVVIPLGYNFDLYDKPDSNEVLKLKESIKCDLCLITIGRMVKNKNHILVLRALKTLKKRGLKIKLILVDDGPEKGHLVEFVTNNNLNDSVIFTGFLSNIMNYLATADVLVCPSISEASNQVVKEAGLLQKPSVVIKSVGDFQEYIIQDYNGFFISMQNAEDDLINTLTDIYNKKHNLTTIGKEIKQVIQSKFDIKHIVDKYLSLIN